MSQMAERTYFKIPFDEKDEAKSYGAMFDGTGVPKLWYAPDEMVRQRLAERWPVTAPPNRPEASSQQPPWPQSSPSPQKPFSSQLSVGGSQQRIAYEVPFAEKDQAKDMGALFDGDMRKWCAARHPEQKLISPSTGRRMMRWPPPSVPD